MSKASMQAMLEGPTTTDESSPIAGADFGAWTHAHNGLAPASAAGPLTNAASRANGSCAGDGDAAHDGEDRLSQRIGDLRRSWTPSAGAIPEPGTDSFLEAMAACIQKHKFADDQQAKLEVADHVRSLLALDPDHWCIGTLGHRIAPIVQRE
jgi:hypothetical protein